MKTPTILTFIAFCNSVGLALLVRGLCDVFHWPWFVSLIMFIVIFPVLLFLLCLVSASGAEVRR